MKCKRILIFLFFKNHFAMLTQTCNVALTLTLFLCKSVISKSTLDFAKTIVHVIFVYLWDIALKVNIRITGCNDVVFDI